MIENAKLFDRLLLENKLRPIDPNDPVPLYDVDEIRIAWLAYSRMSRGFAHMKQSVSQIEPAYSRFDDFISPQARIDAAQQDEKQIIICGRFQDARNSFLVQPITTTDAAWNYDPDVPSWRAHTAPLDLDCPSKQRPNNHDIAFSGRLLEAAGQEAIVPLLDVGSPDCLKRRAGAKA